MRRALLILFVIIAAPVLLWCGLSRWKQHNEDRLTITWTPATSTFDWYAASVVLPSGFTHRRLTGCDTLMGELISPDGQVVVEYDIGQLAGEHGGGFCFPSAGCACFRLVHDSPAGREAIRQIGATFQPRTRIPNWLARLVPEFVRVHCRCRFPFL